MNAPGKPLHGCLLMILTKTLAVCTLPDVEKCVNHWLISSKLSLNVAKTKFMINFIRSNQWLSMLSKLLKIRYFNIEVDAEWTNKIKAKSLGLIIDGHLSWTKLVDEMSRKIFSAVGPKETALLIRITKLWSCVTLTIIIFVVLSGAIATWAINFKNFKN